MPPTGKPERVEHEHIFTQADFNHFADLSGDHNPIHVDPMFAADTRFGATVAHGMLLFSIVRGDIERHYPGAHMVSQNVKFPVPAYAGETLTLVLTPQSAPANSELCLATQVIKANGEICLEGDCQLLIQPEVVT